MEIWLDTIEIECIREGAQMGLVRGVTTNPLILSEATDINGVLDELLSVQTGPVAIQVTAIEAQEMVRQGRLLSERSSRIIVKIPVNREGLAAIRQLSLENIPTLGTAILQPKQALLAASAGAQYIAPYLSHMGEEAIQALKEMHEILKHQEEAPKIVVASVKSLDHIIECAQMGVFAVTLKADIFHKLADDDPRETAFTSKFNREWDRQFQDRPFSELFFN